MNIPVNTNTGPPAITSDMHFTRHITFAAYMNPFRQCRCKRHQIGCLGTHSAGLCQYITNGPARARAYSWQLDTTLWVDPSHGGSIACAQQHAVSWVYQLGRDGSSGCHMKRDIQLLFRACSLYACNNAALGPMTRVLFTLSVKLQKPLETTGD